MISNKIKGYLGLAAKAGKVVAGFDAVCECIDKKKAKIVIVSKDASQKTKNNIKLKCDINSIDYIEYERTYFLSKAIGKNNKAILCIKDSNFANVIKNIIDGGDIV